MEQYELFYRGFFIGVLTVENGTGKHHYEPIPEGVSKVQNMTSLTREMREGTDGYVTPIPFFENRLRNMKRFGLDEINYQTDYFLLKKRE